MFRASPRLRVGSYRVVRAKMIEHDEQVGSLLKKLDDLGVTDNTIVVYTTDNCNERADAHFEGFLRSAIAPSGKRQAARSVGARC